MNEKQWKEMKTNQKVMKSNEKQWNNKKEIKSYEKQWKKWTAKKTL